MKQELTNSEMTGKLKIKPRKMNVYDKFYFEKIDFFEEKEKKKRKKVEKREKEER